MTGGPHITMDVQLYCQNHNDPVEMRLDDDFSDGGEFVCPECGAKVKVEVRVGS